MKKPERGKLKFPKPEKRKKTKRTALRDKLDTIFSAYIRERDKCCVQCGSPYHLTCGHVFSRGHWNTRWDETNAFGQCRDENCKHEYDPYPFYKWYQDTYGIDTFDALYQKWNGPSKFTLADLEILIDTYTERYNTLCKGETYES